MHTIMFRFVIDLHISGIREHSPSTNAAQVLFWLGAIGGSSLLFVLFLH